ncbi:MAG TPA: SurA N-terminal domain-containing protein [Burkholderiales bacterium]|nr:SurA N-terminal domain-containing protein [Burkholderiales bacterium]
MFDFVHRHKRILQVVLAIIFLPFAFFGVDSYFHDSGSGRSVVKVGDYEIHEQEIANALRERQDQLRNLSGGRIDPALLDSPELRMSVIDALVRQRVLIDHALRVGMTVPEDQLRGYIAQVPAFQDDGKFVMAKYEQFLKARGENVTSFQNRVQQELLLGQLAESYTATSIVPRTVAERLLHITEQSREVSRAVVSPDKFVSQVKLEDDAAKKYYDSHQDEFRTPEQVRIEYVTLSIDGFAPEVKLDPANVKKFYDENQRQFGVGETRQASHILIAADKSAGEDAKKKAQAEAERIYNELKKNPAAFGELAKKYSQDPGSAAKGGDLGTFGRGTMVKAFDDAVFGMKPGEISQPVETEYGYHIIRVTAVNPAQMKSFDEVRPAIEKELRKQQALQLYAKAADEFNNKLFEQSESLKGAADVAKVQPKTSGWISRQGTDDPVLNNPKLIQAVFSEDVRVNKRNTEAIELAPGTIIGARVAEHKPSALQAFADVKAAIEKKVVQTRANQLAAQEGRKLLEQLKKGESADVSWDAPQLVSRKDTKSLPEPVVRQVFKADTHKLPSYTGVEAPGGGFVLLKVTRVVDSDKTDRAQAKSLNEGLAQVLGEEQFNAYLASLKAKAKVKIDKEQFEKKQ